jgi:hypothetical protein
MQWENGACNGMNLALVRCLSAYDIAFTAIFFGYLPAHAQQKGQQNQDE